MVAYMNLHPAYQAQQAYQAQLAHSTRFSQQVLSPKITQQVQLTQPFARKVAVVLVVLVSALLLSVFAVSGQAHADTSYDAAQIAPNEFTQNVVKTISAKERKAYNRAVSACMDYANQPNPIVVDMSDLGLTAKEALNVGEMLHGNGELFWIDTYNDLSFGRKTFSLPCYYDDATITSMRKELNKAVKQALKRIGPGMSQSTKVHMLYDYLIDKVKYVSKSKNAYTGLVEKSADCFGYTLSMDVLLRRAGFTTDVAFNSTLDHSWNLVKVGSNWFHVDVTFGHSFTGRQLYYDRQSDGQRVYSKYFDWRNEHCHLYLLQSDLSMNSPFVDPDTGILIKSNNGWSCHHKCSNRKFDDNSVAGAGGTLRRYCKDYRKIVRSFNKEGLQYEVIGYQKAKVKGVATKANRAASSLTIPVRASYKGVQYKVSGIAPKSFSKANAKTLNVESPYFSKASVRDSLKDSKVKTIKLLQAAKKKRAAYKKYFAKANSGKKVSVVVGK